MKRKAPRLSHRNEANRGEIKKDQQKAPKKSIAALRVLDSLVCKALRSQAHNAKESVTAMKYICAYSSGQGLLGHVPDHAAVWGASGEVPFWECFEEK